MKIRLNGTETEIASRRLDQALDELGYGGALVATAVNGDFVPKDARSCTQLDEADRLEVVAPLKGG